MDGRQGIARRAGADGLSGRPQRLCRAVTNRETDMTNAKMTEQVRNGRGFIAALDQSGGSTPKALKLYGVSETEYSGEEAMFDLIHAMRARIIKSPAFTGDKVVGAILFEQTMDRDDRRHPDRDLPVGQARRGAVPEDRQGAGGGSRRRAADEADAGAGCAAGAGGEGGHLRHQGTVGDQCRQPQGDRGDRGAAVRALGGRWRRMG